MRDELRWILPMVSRRLGDLPVALFLRGGGPELPTHWISRGIEELTGYSRLLFTEEPSFWLERIHPDDRPGVVRRLRRLEPGERASLRYRLRLAGDESRWVREEVRSEGGGAEGISRYVGIVRDAEEEVRAGERVERLEERIRRSERGESLGGLAAGIAHDFNNLLTAVLTTAQLLRQEGGLGDDADDDLRVIEDAARRGSRLVRQILGFAGRPSQEPERLDLRAVVSETLAFLRRSLGEDIRIEVESDDDLWPVEADPALVERVVVNLAVNARDAMPAGGRLSIALGNDALAREEALERFGVVPGRYVRLVVRDSGTGIPDDLRERVFEPFFTTKGTNRAGAGIGLSTVRRIVRDHGGAVEVESREGAGTAVHVIFPRSRRGLEEEEPPRRPPAGEELDRRLRILLVDDDRAVRDAVADALVRNGHEVIAAATGVEAVDRFGRAAGPVDVLVTDVVLPDRSGLSLHRILEARAGPIPAVFVSGYSRRELDARVDLPVEAPFVRKPFDPGGLQRAIARALGAGGEDDVRRRGGGRGA